MDLFAPWGFYSNFRGYRTAEVHRPSKPTVAGSNPAARSNSASTFSIHQAGARDAQREGCR